MVYIPYIWYIPHIYHIHVHVHVYGSTTLAIFITFSIVYYSCFTKNLLTNYQFECYCNTCY